MEFLNLSNFSFNPATEKVDNLSFQQIIEIFDIFSIFFDFFCTSIIIQSKNKLVLAEFWILISIPTTLIFIKVFFFFIIIFPNLAIISHKNYSCITIYSFSNLLVQFYLILLFYCLFHLSMIKRTGIFRILFNLTRNTRLFLYFYLISFITIYLSNWLWYFFISEKEFTFDKSNSSCKKKNNSPDSSLNPYLFDIIISVLLSFVLIFIYLSLSVFFFVRKSYKKKKLHRISLKFFIFSLFSSSISFQSLSVILRFFSIEENSIDLLSNIITVILMIFQSLIVLYIHNILNELVIEKLSKVKITNVLKSFKNCMGL